MDPTGLCQVCDTGIGFRFTGLGFQEFSRSVPALSAHGCSESHLAFRRRSRPATQRPSFPAMAGSLRNRALEAGHPPGRTSLPTCCHHAIHHGSGSAQVAGFQPSFRNAGVAHPQGSASPRRSASDAHGGKKEPRSRSGSRPADSSLPSHSCHQRSSLSRGNSLGLGRREALRRGGPCVESEP